MTPDDTTPPASVPIHSENRGGSRKEHVLTPSQVKRLSQWLPSRQNAVKRLWSGKGGRKLAIHLQCLDCCGEDVDAVRTCGDRCCPLWHFRPFQKH